MWHGPPRAHVCVHLSSAQPKGILLTSCSWAWQYRAVCTTPYVTSEALRIALYTSRWVSNACVYGLLCAAPYKPFRSTPRSLWRQPPEPMSVHARTGSCVQLRSHHSGLCHDPFGGNHLSPMSVSEQQSRCWTAEQQAFARSRKQVREGVQRRLLRRELQIGLECGCRHVHSCAWLTDGSRSWLEGLTRHVWFLILFFRGQVWSGGM